MPLRALDTNGYVELIRNGPRAAAIRAALRTHADEVTMLLPVMAELQFGARDPAQATQLVQRFLDPVPPQRRIAARPDEWIATGAAVAALRGAGFSVSALEQRGLFLDVHIARLCRSRGVILWTDDTDHARLRGTIGHSIAPLPS